VKKQEEYRIHVVHDDIVLAQRKARRFDRETVDWRVRNLANGFVFCMVDVADIPRDAREQSIMTVRALGIDFGAVDIIWNSHYNRSYVLEVNCAPGLEERTAHAYAEAFRNV
jgi:glutathione synthase/RimK-type ligase-like ATP-grasp enzyme